VVQRVAELEQHLQAAQEAKEALEASMKRAFMRGVCALNMEASCCWLALAEEISGMPGCSNSCHSMI
jgi:hypothetical protein